jgi:hypothetical protein
MSFPVTMISPSFYHLFVKKQLVSFKSIELEKK